MVVERVDEDYVKLTNPPKGKVLDVRTNRKYKTVVCKDSDTKHFRDA